MTLRATLAAAAAVQLAGLLAVGWWFREALNTDAVAYLRLAEYYAQGKWGLALNGYWGPLLSWLLTPLLVLGCPPWLAARFVMGLCAAIFWVGCNQWFLSLRWDEAWKKAGVWTAALVSIPCSVANVTPDLLLAGLLAWVWAALYQARQEHSARWCFAAGALAGLACLAKAVALPVAGLAACAWLGCPPAKNAPPRKSGVRFLGLFFLGAALVSAPWFAALSWHYGQLTLTRSAAIAHALAGPPDVDRYHPTFHTFHAPPPGRLTTWEDPSAMAYAAWAPWDSAAHAWHQAKVILKNLALMQLMLTTLFLDWPVVLGWSGWWWRRQRRTLAWPDAPDFLRLAALGLAALMVVYAPNYLRLGDQRYFYPALPLLFVAGAWMVEGFYGLLPEARRWLRLALPLSFLIPALALLFWWLPPKRAAGQVARALAEELRAANLRGPVAGSALQPGGRTGLMVAYYLETPWLGDQPDATVEDVLRSGAALFCVNRQDPLAKALAAHPRCKEAPASASAATRPVAVFRIAPPGAGAP